MMETTTKNTSLQAARELDASINSAQGSASIGNAGTGSALSLEIGPPIYEDGPDSGGKYQDALQMAASLGFDTATPVPSMRSDTGAAGSSERNDLKSLKVQGLEDLFPDEKPSSNPGSAQGGRFRGVVVVVVVVVSSSCELGIEIEQEGLIFAGKALSL